MHNVFDLRLKDSVSRDLGPKDIVKGEHLLSPIVVQRIIGHFLPQRGVLVLGGISLTEGFYSNRHVDFTFHLTY